MSNTSSSSSNGGGVLGLLGVVFVTLKLCHVINWSWWWVTAPFWGGFGLLLAIALLWLFVWVVLHTGGVFLQRHRRRGAASLRRKAGLAHKEFLRK